MFLKNKKFWANFLLVSFSVFITLILIELVLRIIGLHSPVLYRSNENSAYSLKENQSTKYFFNPISVNDLGMRDTRNLIQTKKTDKTIRIGVFGDSVTWGGVYIKQAELFTTLLEKQLQTTYPDLKIEVFNGGVNGYSVDQVVARMHETQEEIQWDVVIFYLIEGDFYRNPYLKLIHDGAPFYQTKRTLALKEVLAVGDSHYNMGTDCLQRLGGIEQRRGVERVQFL